MAQFDIRDPFTGWTEIEGDTLEEAIESAYQDVPEDECPAYVWYEGQQVAVPGGTAKPTQ